MLERVPCTPLGDRVAWTSGKARIRCWPVPGDGWPGSTRHPWNHNEHFHGWMLRNLPARRRAAVDVGCGTGVLAGNLAPRFARVTGIDADAGMAAAASTRLAQDPRVTIRRCGFEQFASAAGDGDADLITMVAVLHHLGLDDTLARIPGLLAPSGRLLVVGLARVNSLPDLEVDLISAAANPVMGLIRYPRPARPADGPEAGQGARRAFVDTRLAEIRRLLGRARLLAPPYLEAEAQCRPQVGAEPVPVGGR